MPKMTSEAKTKLKNLPRARCAVCGSFRTYHNPMAVCFECGKKFCYDHIFGGQINPKMKENEGIRDVCDECRKKFDYQSV